MITGIVHLGKYTHHKNLESLHRMCRKLNVPLSNDVNDVKKPEYNLIMITDGVAKPTYPGKIYVFGPHVWFYDVPELHDLSREPEFPNCYFNMLTDNTVRYVESMGEVICMPYCALPFPIDTELWTPAEKENVAIVYIKDRAGSDVDAVVRRFKEHFHDLQFHEFNYSIGYKEEDLLRSSKIAKVCLFIGCHESQGFAFQQILSCNVPIICYDAIFADIPSPNFMKYGVMSVRSMWSDKCGEYFYHPNMIDRVLPKYDHFSKKNRYAPREFIVSELSDEVCFRKWSDFVKTKLENKTA